jgi:hypothetical protein
MTEPELSFAERLFLKTLRKVPFEVRGLRALNRVYSLLRLASGQRLGELRSSTDSLYCQ